MTVEVTEKASKLKTNLLLYCVYFLTCLEDRTWAFCVSICMDIMGGMRMVSFEQFFEGILQMFFSVHLGKYFDKLTRRRAITTVVPLNNLSICAASALVITCLSTDSSSSGYQIYLLIAMFLCALNQLFQSAEKTIIGKDWVMVLGGEKDLSKLNATLLTLDQFTNVIGPLIMGILVSWVGLRGMLGIFGVSSLVALILKALFLKSLYISNPSLHIKKDRRDQTINPHLNKSVLQTYWLQDSFPAAFGMSLLYMTVMGFGGLAVGYGSSAGLPGYIIGGFRSFGSIAAILGSLSYAIFEKRYGVNTAGLIGLIVQQTCALLAVVSVFLPGSPMNINGYLKDFTIENWSSSMAHSFDKKNKTGYDPHIDWSNFTSDGVSLASIVMFLVAISTARYGLWCLDLATTHIMQITIPENERNTVFGMHNALCQMFSVLKDILVIVLPLPSTFAICIFVSYAFVTTGHLCFVYYFVKSKQIDDLKKKA
ncbi:unnamed protein product [Caenorhabditis nigoni]